MYNDAGAFSKRRKTFAQQPAQQAATATTPTPPPTPSASATTIAAPGAPVTVGAPPPRTTQQPSPPKPAGPPAPTPGVPTYGTQGHFDPRDPKNKGTATGPMMQPLPPPKIPSLNDLAGQTPAMPKPGMPQRPPRPQQPAFDFGDFGNIDFGDFGSMFGKGGGNTGGGGADFTPEPREIVRTDPTVEASDNNNWGGGWGSSDGRDYQANPYTEQEFRDIQKRKAEADPNVARTMDYKPSDQAYDDAWKKYDQAGWDAAHKPAAPTPGLNFGQQTPSTLMGKGGGQEYPLEQKQELPATQNPQLQQELDALNVQPEDLSQAGLGPDAEMRKVTYKGKEYFKWKNGPWEENQTMGYA